MEDVAAEVVAGVDAAERDGCGHFVISEATTDFSASLAPLSSRKLFGWDVGY